MFIVPVLYFGSYAAYEYLWAVSCTRVNIRLDIYVLWPLMAAMLFAFLLKLLIMLLRRRRV